MPCSASGIRRPDAGGDDGVRPGRPAGGDHAVPADGRHVAGQHRGLARPAAGGGVRRHRAGAAGAARYARAVRIVPVEHRHAVGVAQLRHAGVRARPALHRAAGATLRAAVPLRRRPDRQPDGRRAGLVRGDDDDAAHVPGGRQLGDALGGLARVGAGLLLREVHRRHRDPADAQGGVHAARDRRGQPGVRRPRGGRAGRALPRRRAHAGAVSRLLLPAAAVVHGELRALGAQRRQRCDARAAGLLWREALDEYQQPPLDDAIRDELQEYVVRRRAELGD